MTATAETWANEYDARAPASPLARDLAPLRTTPPPAPENAPAGQRGALAGRKDDTGKPEWRLVAIESPFAGDVHRNLRYVRACMADCFRRGEYPIASHALYTQPGVLRDEVPAERILGIHAGLTWAEKADARVVYGDLGMSRGMEYGIAHAVGIGQPVEYRRLGGEWGSAEEPTP